MIDIESERLLTLIEAAAALPHCPALSTLHRWRLRGVRGVKLETVLLGGRRYTSLEALKRFASATTAAGTLDTVLETQPASERQAIKRAEQELDRAGI